MAKVSIKGNELIKHTSAIHVSNTISIIERKISNILLRNSFAHLAQKEKHSIFIKDIINLLGWSSDNNYELIKASLKKLNSTQIEWNILKKDKKNEWGVATIISGAKIKNGVCEYSYSPILRELLAIPNIYAKLNMAIQAKFNSKYSLTLWEFLIEMLCSANKDNITTGFIDLESIRKILGIEGVKIYEEFKILNRDVLKKAISEINLISDITAEYFTKKNGKKIIAIGFKILRKKDFDYPLLNLESNSLNRESVLGKIDEIKVNSNVVKLLTMEFNISLKKAQEIMNLYSSEKISQTIDYVRIQISNNKIKNTAAYLISSLKENWNLGLESISNENNIKGQIIETNNPLWTSILQCLNNTYGTPLYISWFSKLEFIHYDNKQNSLCLKTNTEFLKNWIESNYKRHILRAAQTIDAQIQEIEIIL